MDTQTRAMSEAAQSLFRAEIDPTLQRLLAPLRQLVRQEDRIWEHWLMHAATAVVASTLTWVLTAWPWTR